MSVSPAPDPSAAASQHAGPVDDRERWAWLWGKAKSALAQLVFTAVGATGGAAIALESAEHDKPADLDKRKPDKPVTEEPEAIATASVAGVDACELAARHCARATVESRRALDSLDQLTITRETKTPTATPLPDRDSR